MLKEYNTDSVVIGEWYRPSNILLDAEPSLFIVTKNQNHYSLLYQTHIDLIPSGFYKQDKNLYKILLVR